MFPEKRRPIFFSSPWILVCYYSLGVLYIHPTDTNQRPWICWSLLLGFTPPLVSWYNCVSFFNFLEMMIPDVKSGNDGRILGLVTTADVITAALVGHQLFMRLYDDRVEVLDESVFLQNASHARKTPFSKTYRKQNLKKKQNGVYSVDEHGVARTKRHSIGELIAELDIKFGHARRFLG